MMPILYLYRSGRKSRLIANIDGPTEFFYGYHQLLADGMKVEILEDSDIGMAPPLTPLPRMINKFSPLVGGIPIGMAIGFLIGGYFRILNNARCIVATTTGIGISLAIGRIFGLVRVPVIMLAMGILPSHPSKIQKFMYRILCENIHIVCLSKTEYLFLKNLLALSKIKYLPFGIDNNYWTSGDDFVANEEYALAIGNDKARDWVALVDAWSDDLPKLKIITSLNVPNYKKNIEVICGDWRNQLLTDNQIRNLYRGAKFTVIPLKDTLQPAGQSVCLQAMACGSPVILSNISGLWDRDLMIHGKNVILVKPGSSVEISRAAKCLNSNSQLRLSLAINAKTLIDQYYNVRAMANELRVIIEGAC